MTTTSSHLESTSPPRSTLPPELIHQILQDSSLSKSNLARCCLVNRVFLHSARPLLYAEITVSFTRINKNNEWGLDRATELLFQTLSETPLLGRYARKLSFLADPKSKGEEETDVYSGLRCVNYGEVVEQALGMLPLLESVDLGAHLSDSDHVKEIVFNRGSQWKEIAVDDVLLYQNADGNRRTWSELPNLRKLRCKIVSFDSGDTSSIPDHLEVLDIIHPSSRHFPLSLSPQSQLRVLRVIPFNSTLQHLGYMRQLRHLYLSADCAPGSLSLETLTALSRLPLLESLSVEYRGSTQRHDNTIRSLLHHVPSSLHRLAFPHCIPFEALTQFFQSDETRQIQTLGLDRRLPRYNLRHEESRRRMEQLRVICEEKGIAIGYVDLREDIFLV
ncbi:hypothetical protein JCM5353_007667 [Sporobolomyces roseus]